MDLTCPKCHGAMRQYERNAVVVDQCTECRGVFLDRGELDKLIDAEARWADGAAPPAAAPAQQQQYQQPGYQQHQQPGYQQQGYQQPYEQGRRQQSYQRHGYQDEYRKKHRRKSFLDELFD